MVEVAVVAKMEKASESREDAGPEAVAASEVMEDALKIIESCQVSKLPSLI